MLKLGVKAISQVRKEGLSRSVSHDHVMFDLEI